MKKIYALLAALFVLFLSLSLSLMGPSDLPGSEQLSGAYGETALTRAEKDRVSLRESREGLPEATLANTPIVRGENNTVVFEGTLRQDREFIRHVKYNGGILKILETEESAEEFPRYHLNFDREKLDQFLASKAEIISVPLSPGRQIDVSVQKTVQRSLNTHSLIGKVVGNPTSEALLVFHEGAVSGVISFYDRQEYHQFGSTPDGALTTVTQLDPAEQKGECGTCADSLAANSIQEPRKLSERKYPWQNRTKTAGGGNSFIETVVGYGRVARTNEGGKEAMEAKIFAAVDRVNIAFENSGISSAEFRLVGLIEDPDYVFPGEDADSMWEELGDLDDGENDVLDSVSDLRVSLGADFQHFIVDVGHGGLAGGANRGGISAVTARIDMSSSRLVFVHEVGHNLNCRHAWGDTDGNTEGFNRGWRFLVESTVIDPGTGQQVTEVDQYGTVMAYGVFDENFVTIPYFSNPGILFQGVRTGAVSGYDASADSTVDLLLISGGGQSVKSKEEDEVDHGAGYDGSNPSLGAHNTAAILERLSISANRLDPNSNRGFVWLTYGDEVIANGDAIPSLTKGTEFESKDFGTSNSRDFEIRNSGEDQLIVSNFQSSDPEFSFSETDFVIESGGSKTVTVTHIPADRFLDLSKITFETSDVDFRNFSFWVSAEVQSSSISVSYDGVLVLDGQTIVSSSDGTDFGDSVPIGSTVLRRFTVHNTGDDSLALSNFFPTSGGSDFRVSGSSNVFPDSTGYLEVRFSPSDGTPVNRVVSFWTNDPDHSTYSFSVGGQGVVAPEIAVEYGGEALVDGQVLVSSADGTNFGDVGLGGSKSRDFVVRNMGSSDLSLSGFASSNNRYTVSANQSTIAPGGVGLLTVNFVPNAFHPVDPTSPEPSTISFATNDQDEGLFSFAVTGRGKLASTVSVRHNGQAISNGELEVSTSAGTYFGASVPVGTSVVRDFAIRNDGTGILTLSDFKVTNSEYAIESSPTTLLAGQSGNLRIRYSPTDSDPDYAFLSFKHGLQGDEFYRFRLYGGGDLSPLISVSYDGADIPNGYSGATLSNNGTKFCQFDEEIPLVRGFVITNEGSEPLMISGAFVSDTEFMILSSPDSLAVGQSGVLRIAYDSEDDEDDVDSLVIVSNDPNANSYSFAILGDTIDSLLGESIQATGAGAGDRYSVSISGNYAVLGHSGDSTKGEDAGAVYIFDVTTGQQLRKLTATEGQPGDEFGRVVEAYGDYLAISAPGDDDRGANAGAAYLFKLETGEEVFKLFPSDLAPGDGSRMSLSIHGDKLVYGTPFHDSVGNSSGRAYVFDLRTGVEVQNLRPVEIDAGEQFGSSVSINDDFILVGAPLKRNEMGDTVGAAYLFDLETGDLIQDLIPDLEVYEPDSFGEKVLLTPDYAVVSSPWTGGSGSVFVYDLSSKEILHELSFFSSSSLFGNSIDVSDNVLVVGNVRGSSFAYDLDTGARLSRFQIPNAFSSVAFGLSGNYVLMGLPKESEMDDLGSATIVEIVCQGDPELLVQYGSSSIVNGETAVSAARGTELCQFTVEGQSVSREFTIQNTGKDVLQLSNFNVTSGEFMIQISDNAVSPGQESILTVTYMPADAVQDDATISFDSNDPNQATFSFAVRGTLESTLTETKVMAETPLASSLYGSAVDLSGHYAVIGHEGGRNEDDVRSGAAHVVNVNTGNRLHKLVPSGAEVNSNSGFGHAVAISGWKYVLVGAPQERNNFTFEGAVYVFDLASGEELFKLKPSDGQNSDRFGAAVAILGDYAIIGSPDSDDRGGSSGSVYIFDLNTGEQVNKILAEDAAFGDKFGSSVSASEGYFVVGAPNDDHESGSNAGSAYLYSMSSALRSSRHEWKYTASDGEANDLYGSAVSLHGDTLVIGAYLDDDNGTESGSAYVYDISSDPDHLFKLAASDAEAGDHFGRSLSVSDGYVLVGAQSSDDIGNASGSAYLFNAETGSEVMKVIASDQATGDTYGSSVAISNNHFIVGSPRDNSGATSSGSAYIYEIPCFDRDSGGYFDAIDLIQIGGVLQEGLLPGADPLGRGIPNGLSYGLGIPLDRISLGEDERSLLPQIAEGILRDTLAVRFVIPANPPEDAIYCVMQSESLQSQDWVEVARKEGGGSWTGGAYVTQSPLGEDKTELIVESPKDRVEARRNFMRLDVLIRGSE